MISSPRDQNVGRIPPKVKKPLFIAKHQHQFGLIIKARDATIAKVTSVACRFCITFEKEEVGCKRKATSNVKYFESLMFLFLVLEDKHVFDSKVCSHRKICWR